MSPYELIRRAYLKHGASGSGLTWEELVGWHLADPNSYVVKTPEYFVMGRAVIRAAGENNIRDFRVSFEPSKCDAWFLYAFAGDMRKAWAAMPFKLPWMAWERFGDSENELRWIKTAAIYRHSH